MTEIQKKEIQSLLNIYCGDFDSQSQAAASLKDISEANVIAIRKGKWESVSDNMFRNVGKQVGWNELKKVQVDTLDFETLILYFGIARENGATFAITGNAGYGKTFAGKWYRDAMRGKPVYYMECAQHLNRKYFLVKLIETMGKKPDGKSVYEMMEFIISELRKQDQPLIILDEVDKLKDDVLQFFITFYNELNGLCGIVWTSTDSIQKRIRHGLRLNKSGYNEIFRRIGRSFIELKGTNAAEVKQLCEANGITDPELIHKIRNEYGGDISRIDREALKKRLKESGKRKLPA